MKNSKNNKVIKSHLMALQKGDGINKFIHYIYKQIILSGKRKNTIS